MIRDFPNFIDAYTKYWMIAEEERNLSEMEYISSKMLKKAEKPIIPSFYWVEAVTIRARTLVAL